MYLTASGTLTQFNAIMAAIDSAALATAVSRTLSGVLIAALTLHVLAAFILCWAARPVEPAPEMMTAALIADRYTQAAHTFRNYRRGWRFTLIALATTAVAAGVFVLCIEVPHLLAPSS